MTVDSILSLIAPQFNDITNKNDYISLARLRVNACMFGDKTNLAIAYMTAHLIAVSTDPARGKGEAGNITSKKEGDLSVTYGNFNTNTNGNSDLNMTSYGQSFQGLLNGTIPAVWTLGEFCE